MNSLWIRDSGFDNVGMSKNDGWTIIFCRWLVR